MIWLGILIAIVAAFVFRIVACIKKSKQAGADWDFAEKYAANEFGE